MAEILVRRQGRPPTMVDPRRRILDEAAEVFARDGYDGASLGSVADAIGITKAAIYHYFPNKKGIYDAIIVRTLEGLLAFVTAEVGVNRNAEQALLRFMTAHAVYFEANYHAFVMMLVGFGGMENIEMVSDARRSRAAYETLLRSIIASGVTDKSFRDVDVRVTARAILSSLNWMARWFTPGRGRTAASFAKEYYELMLYGIRDQNKQAPARETPRARLQKTSRKHARGT